MIHRKIDLMMAPEKDLGDRVSVLSSIAICRIDISLNTTNVAVGLEEIIRTKRWKAVDIWAKVCASPLLFRGAGEGDA